MFGKMYDRFNWGSRRVRLAAIAGICAAGLAIGIGGGTLMAQLTGGNPVPGVENTGGGGNSSICCGVSGGCGLGCANSPSLGTSSEVVPAPWHSCISSSQNYDAGKQCTQNGPMMTCGTIEVFAGSGCSGDLLYKTDLQEPSCGVNSEYCGQGA